MRDSGARTARFVDRPRLWLAGLLAAVVAGSGLLQAAPGDLDPTFGTLGKVVTDFSGTGSSDVAHALAIDSSGNLVVAGASNGDFALARYTPDGNLDPTFGSGGGGRHQFHPERAF